MDNVEEISLAGSALGGSPPPLENEADDSREDPEGAPDEAREAAPLSPVEEEARRVLLRRIQRYSAVFPDEVAGYDLSQLSTMSPAELERTLEDVVFLVESRRTTAQARGIFLAGLSLGEASGPYIGLKLSGPHSLTATAANSTDILRTVDEIALKYESIARIDPVHRLGLSLAQLALAVDRANRAADKATVVTPPAAPATSKPAPAPAPRQDNIAVREGFSDL
jgi:hypothetical protein